MLWTVVLDKTLEGPLDCKCIQPVHPKGSQSWIFIGGTDAEAETLILWPPDVKNWLTGKDSDAGKDWRREEKGMTEDEMVGWHHWLDGHKFEQAVGVGDWQGSLTCSPLDLRVGHWETKLTDGNSKKPSGTIVNNLPAKAEDTRDVNFIPGSGWSPGVGNGNPLQYYCLKDLMDRKTWQVHWVTKSQTQLSTTPPHTSFKSFKSYLQLT